MSPNSKGWGFFMSRDLENTKRLRKEWYERNKELTKQRARAWALANPEKNAIAKTKWREENRELHNALNREWNYNNKDKKAALQAKRKAAQLQRTPPWLSKDDLKTIAAFYEVANKLTQATGEIWHVDHVLPLQGKKVSGLHVPQNLRVIRASVNIKKSNKYEI